MPPCNFTIMKFYCLFAIIGQIFSNIFMIVKILRLFTAFTRILTRKFTITKKIVKWNPP
jgi:hypothetical protein